MKDSHPRLSAANREWLISIDVLVSHNTAKPSAVGPRSAVGDNVAEFH